MRLDQELVIRHLCESRQEAQECIAKGFVTVDGHIVTKQTKQVTEANQIVVSSRRKFVGRGGEKLEGAILEIYPDATIDLFKGKTAIDVGSSTGGFTDCLLSYGIEHVDAVDVGTSQLHASLLNNPKITLYENTDIRKYIATSLFDIIVADVSFVSLEIIIDVILSLGHTSSEYFLLIKPQFEVGSGNTKKGIVKNEELVQEVLQKYKSLLQERGKTTIAIFPCALKGGDGNQEYFVYCK
jgi:23S rRNA (cytidine1920-2'-O)/16S rRNA (cytidine1409-2'-O)-methyltransferase